MRRHPLVPQPLLPLPSLQPAAMPCRLYPAGAAGVPHRLLQEHGADPAGHLQGLCPRAAERGGAQELPQVGRQHGQLVGGGERTCWPMGCWRATSSLDVAAGACGVQHPASGVVGREWRKHRRTIENLLLAWCWDGLEPFLALSSWLWGPRRVPHGEFPPCPESGTLLSWISPAELSPSACRQLAETLPGRTR